jgi:undecaprenyl-diphosphatase
MYVNQSSALFARFDAAEFGLCVRMNGSCDHRYIRTFFRIISRLGDGVVWYLLMLGLPVCFGERGLVATGVLALTGAVGLLLYKALKSRLVRERPCITFESVVAATRALDRYSFPSGHTLHAVAFSCVAIHYFPVLAWVLVPFTVLIAASRVILGLHYPSDVCAGALLGAGLARIAVTVF